MKKLTGIMLLLFLVGTATTVQAGVWANFWGAMGKAMDDYNTDMLNTGNAVNAALKNGKIMEAFTSYDTNIQLTGDHALANSKAVYKALKDIVLWLPHQIKKIWDKFVAILQKIRDSLAALNNQLGGGNSPSAPLSTKGSSTYATVSSTRGFMDAWDPIMHEGGSGDNSSGSPSLAGLGDGFVEKFANDSALEDKLKTFARYRGHVVTMDRWMQGLKKRDRRALEPNYQKVRNESSLLEEILFKEISSSLDSDGKAMREFNKFLSKADPKVAGSILGSLTKKLSRRMSMAVTNSDDNRLNELMSDFVKARKSAGIN